MLAAMPARDIQCGRQRDHGPPTVLRVHFPPIQACTRSGVTGPALAVESQCQAAARVFAEVTRILTVFESIPVPCSDPVCSSTTTGVVIGQPARWAKTVTIFPLRHPSAPPVREIGPNDNNTRPSRVGPR